MVKDLLLPATYKFVVLGTMVTQKVFEEYAAFSWANASRIYLYRMMTAQFVIPYSFRDVFIFQIPLIFFRLSLERPRIPNNSGLRPQAFSPFLVKLSA